MSVGEIIGIFAGALAVVISVLTLITLIRKSGESAQKISGAIEHLDEWRREDQKKLSGIADEIKTHVTDAKIHVNPLVEQRDYEARMRFQDEVKTKIDKLLDRQSGK